MSFSSETRHELMIKACYYYYEREYTQTRIAEMLGISRLTLGNLLKEARSTGLVRIEIQDKDNLTEMLKLESELCSRFSLSSAVVVNAVENSKEAVSNAVARAGADFISRRIRSDMKISISWGDTINNMAGRLPYDSSVKNIEVITLLGGAATTNARVQPGMVAGKLLEHYSGRGYVINAPFFCRDELSCRSFRAEQNFIDISAKWQESDLFIVGVGEKPSNDESYWAHTGCSPEMLEYIIQSEAAGDICGSYFDENGAKCCDEFENHRIGIDINEFRGRKNVVVMAGGERKLQAIKAALKGKFMDILVTDCYTARSLLGHGQET